MDALVEGMNGGEDHIGHSLSRARFGIPNHHPLYEPPLPTPPPGVVLGGGKARRTKKHAAPAERYSSDEDEDMPAMQQPTPTKRRPPRPNRTASNSTIKLSVSKPFPEEYAPRTNTAPFPSSSSGSLSRRSSRDSFGSSTHERPKSLAPSISDIIKAYAPADAQARSRVPMINRAPSYGRHHEYGPLKEEPEPDPGRLSMDETSDFLSRTSMDSVADEVQHTIKAQAAMRTVHPTPPPVFQPVSFPRRQSTFSDSASILSPRSEGGAASIYSMSAPSQPAALPHESLLPTVPKPNTSQAVAQYLRSARLTTLLRLRRSPHASADNPLTVSLSDLGDPAGIPIVIFLGLGCVRHIMGLYDEMAEAMGVRLITIDRWGLGRTEPRAKSAKGIMQWASVVEEVLDLLHIQQCSVMAHSAGAPYALSFSNKLARRIRGDVCLLAPWVGGSESGSGYKWLKYVPNGLLKTAQAAEWKLQTWMIGKPPTIAYEGIGFSMPMPPKGSPAMQMDSRPSTSSNFSEYDDLQDFDGRFESKTTLAADSHPRISYEEHDRHQTIKKKQSKGLFERFRAPTSPPTTPPLDEKSPGRRLKALRSMSSLKSKSSSTTPSKKSQTSLPISPQLPPAINFEIGGLGLDDGWTKNIGSQISLPRSDQGVYSHGPSPFRAHGRRSISCNSRNGSIPSSPRDTVFSSNASSLSSPSTPSTVRPHDGFQAALANALIAASHSESSKGTHNDLIQILNHENHPWGFSYAAYPHKVKVWYGDRDEKIAENAVRWMEKAMGEDRCEVNVVPGADHGMMYKSSVVIEVLEHLSGFWRGR